MNKAFIFAGGLIIGIAAGGFGAYKYLKNKMEIQLQDELNAESEKLYKLYEDKLFEEEDDPDVDTKEDLAKMNQNKPDIMEYKNLVEKTNYSSYSDEDYGPEIIDEEDYVEERGHNVVLVTYFHKDNIFIEDVSEKPIKNIKKVLGLDSANDLFDKSTEEGDIFYIRDSRKRIDYEITYSDSYWEEPPVDEESEVD